MPGTKDTMSAKADYLTPFELNREAVVATDADADAVDDASILNLNKNISAVDHNKIFCVLKDTVGAGAEVTLKLYLRTGEGDLTADWIVAEVLQNVPMNTVVKFNALYAGFYKIALEDYAAGSYDIYASYSNVSWETGFQHG